MAELPLPLGREHLHLPRGFIRCDACRGSGRFCGYCRERYHLLRRAEAELALREPSTAPAAPQLTLWPQVVGHALPGCVR